MANEPKRYLITYADGSISTDQATSILGISKKKCKDGVEFMASESSPSKDDVLHFESLGITTIELSAEDAEKLSHNEGVLAVEEDVKMYALGDDEFDAQQFDELFMNSDDSFDYFGDDTSGSYEDGYDQALVDVFASLLKARRRQTGADTSFTPILPKPILPPLKPIPPIILPPLQPIPWNINMVKAPISWSRKITGSGVKVAILDTGIAAHPDLVISGGACFIPGETSYNDKHGHGTHCAGIVAARNNFIGVVGVAPNASLYAVKVLSDSGSGSSSWIIAGMEWCVRNGMKVASMSLGGTSAPMVAYANAVKRCQDNGVTVVIASGNSYGTSFPWVCAPANSIITGQPNASPIAVGSVNSSAVIAGSSSRGGKTTPWNQVHCVAPGVSINSTYPGGGYRVMSGTSMACPHVAGLAALIIQRYPGITPANVKRRIATTATDLGPIGYDITYGFGLINCDLATR